MPDFNFKRSLKDAIDAYRGNHITTRPQIDLGLIDIAGWKPFSYTPDGMDPDPPGEWFKGTLRNYNSGTVAQGTSHSEVNDPYLGRYEEEPPKVQTHVDENQNGIVDDGEMKDTDDVDETYIQKMSTDVNYDLRVVHQTSRQYYGRKEQIIAGDYVMTCGDVFMETGDVYSYGGGKTFTKGNTWDYNWGDKWEEQWGSTGELLIGVAKFELTVVAFECEIDVSALNIDVSIGGEIGIRVGPKLGFEWEGGIEFQFGDKITVKYYPAKWGGKEFTKEAATDPAGPLKKVFKALMGAYSGEYTIGEGWDSEAVKVDSFTDEQKEKFNEAVTEAVQQKVTTKKQELITEAEKAIKESAEEFVKQKKQFIQDEVKKAGDVKLTAMKNEVKALNLKLAGDLTDLSANLLQIKKGTSGAGSVQADLAKATKELLKAKKDVIKAQTEIKLKSTKIKLLNQTIKNLEKTAP